MKYGATGVKKIKKKKIARNVKTAEQRKKGICAMMFDRLNAGHVKKKSAAISAIHAGTVIGKITKKHAKTHARIAGSVLRADVQARNSVKAAKNARKGYG